MINMGFIYADYVTDTTTGSDQKHYFADGTTSFLAEEIEIHCTTATIVKFGDSTEEITVPANAYKTFKQKCKWILYQQSAAPGTIQIWAEGNLNT